MSLNSCQNSNKLRTKIGSMSQDKGTINGFDHNLVQNISAVHDISDYSLAWALLFVLIIIDATWLYLDGMSLKPWPCLLASAVAVILMLVAQIYTRLRPEPRLANLARTMAQLIVYTASAGVLSYLLATNHRSLIDAWLVNADRILGFDWMSMYTWTKSHGATHLALRCAYFSLAPQLLIVQIILFSFRRYSRARELFWLFVFTSMSCIIIGGLIPSEGAFATFHIHADDPYVRDFLALRDGSLKTLDLANLQGIVQFPSFHFAMAVILAYAVRGIRMLFPVFVVWNTIVIAATPLSVATTLPTSGAAH